MLKALGAASAAMLIAACGTGAPLAGNNVTGGTATATGTTAVAPEAVAESEAPAQPALVMPPSWLPAEWDKRLYLGSGEPLPPEGILRSQQNQLNTIPFILWAVSHDTLVTEAFEPIWVWYTAIRSCERGIQMSDDLAGEFGDRARGKAELTAARNALKAWAAKQPPEMTLYFRANLGQWNPETGIFQLQQFGAATPQKPKDIAFIEPFVDGARVEMWTDRTGQAINHFQASLVAPQCATKDGARIYKFERMSQWWVTFGDVDRGMGGLANYRSHAMLPTIRMSREQAAALAQRNPQRKVVVAVTFAPVGSSFVKGTDQSAIRARYRQVTVSDALNDAVLVSQSY